MYLIYIGNNNKFRTEIIPHIVSKNNIFNISKVLLLSEEQNRELEVNLCELNLYLENIGMSVEFQSLDIPKTKDFYLDNSFWASMNRVADNLTSKSVLLLEVNKFKEFQLFLNSDNVNIISPNLKGLFCLIPKNKNIKLFDLSNKTWKNNKVLLLNSEDNYLRDINKSLRKSFKEQNLKRFRHTIRVIETANLIAFKSNIDYLERNKLLLACSYHDFAKNWSLKRLLSYSKKIYPTKSKEELLKDAWNLHGPVASFYLKKHKLLVNEEILEAISHHSTPKEGLSELAKILIIADKIEPYKTYNFKGSTYQKLWSQLRMGQVEEVFQFFLKNFKPKTEWRPEIVSEKDKKK
ncbi:HD domain-containing protein [Mycoplasma suis]|uniref:HD domain protein, nadD domain, putative nicotinate-nucleotide adenylyltransferase n=1 Tax=Mycoplasma suis (strain Illinois) TaxID=768700 RepID=F0QSA3_MYCSL|nr:HD domain-containing protein [Mycoplasma suis]ADX98373.1 HD domain protein, nadD domain, putative nicotinate-nucleotide adenylyltransferase [Mycoplasma suis str. Illinois]